MADLPEKDVEALAEVARKWGVVSLHGEWSDIEAQRGCAKDMLAALAERDARIKAEADGELKAKYDDLKAVLDELRSDEYRTKQREHASWLASEANRHRDRAERAEADLTVLREKIEALADENDEEPVGWVDTEVIRALIPADAATALDEVRLTDGGDE